jgi:hypothetical protein
MYQNPRRHTAEGATCPVILDFLERAPEEGDVAIAWTGAVGNGITEVASFAFFQQ